MSGPLRVVRMKPTELVARTSLARVPMLEKGELRERYPFPFSTVDMREVVRFCGTSRAP